MEPEGSFSWSQKVITTDSYLETHQFSPSQLFMFLRDRALCCLVICDQLLQAVSVSKFSHQNVYTTVLFHECFLTNPKITFSVFLCRSSYSDNAVPMGKRISRLVCTMDRKAELRECDVEWVLAKGRTLLCMKLNH